MPFRDILDPEQLAILAGVLNEICYSAGIKSDSPERQDMASLVLHFHRLGYCTADELKAALDEPMRDGRRSGLASAPLHEHVNRE
jgi:hypothetical protein